MLHQKCRFSAVFIMSVTLMACPTSPEEQQNDITTEDAGNANISQDENVIEPNSQSDIDAGPIVVGGITGRVLNRGREPLSGLKIMACCSTVCRTASTDANGEYLFTDLIIEPRHVQVYDFTNVYLSVLYYQDVFADEMNVLSRDVILPDVTTPPRSLPVATGGTVILADGALELTVSANSLEYPMGYDEDVIQAEWLAGEEIPPYDIEPWLTHKEDSFAFAFYPHKIKTSESAHFTIKTGITQPEGTRYQIWSAQFTTATLHPAGTATVDTNGHLVSDSDSTVRDLTTIILIPDLPSPQENLDAGSSVYITTDAGATSTQNHLDGGQ